MTPHGSASGDDGLPHRPEPIERLPLLYGAELVARRARTVGFVEARAIADLRLGDVVAAALATLDPAAVLAVHTADTAAADHIAQWLDPARHEILAAIPHPHGGLTITLGPVQG